MRIYVANLGRYNEGINQGAWLDLPMDDFNTDFPKFLKSIGVDGVEYEEYAIHDYDDCFFSIHEYESISKLNEYAEIIQNNTNYDKEQMDVLAKWSSTINEFVEFIEEGEIEVRINTSLEDYAYEYIENTELLSSLAENLQGYFDYAAFGRDMSYNGGVHVFDNHLILNY